MCCTIHIRPASTWLSGSQSQALTARISSDSIRPLGRFVMIAESSIQKRHFVLPFSRALVVTLLLLATTAGAATSAPGDASSEKLPQLPKCDTPKAVVTIAADPAP